MASRAEKRRRHRNKNQQNFRRKLNATRTATLLENIKNIFSNSFARSRKDQNQKVEDWSFLDNLPCGCGARTLFDEKCSAFPA